MARPKGQKNVATLIREKKLPREAVDWSKSKRDAYMRKGLSPVADTRTDAEIVEDIRQRFDTYAKVVRASCRGIVNAAIISGSPGIGKTWVAESILKHEAETKDLRFFHVKGTASAFDLYELAYKYQHPNNVILLDDADRLFADEEGMNILKALLDTSENRTVSWMTDHPRFKGEDGLPKSFIYRGSIVFLSNRDFQTEVDDDRGRFVEHMAALLDRSLYIDLAIHERRSIGLWVHHLVSRNRILQGMGLSAKMEQVALEWMRVNRDNLRELSIRTAKKLGTIMKMSEAQDPQIRLNWEVMAKQTLLKKV